MARLIILGATGSLGRQVLQQALAAGHEVTVSVRDPSRLPPDLREHASVDSRDLSEGLPLELVRGQDALINCAGHVADGEAFVGLIDRLVTSVELLPRAEQPVCWFLAGAALLEIDPSERRGVDLGPVKATYWPHQANFERLRRSSLDWRLLCPGPMVEDPPLGIDRLRISLDILPGGMAAAARDLPDPQLVPLFASVVPEMIVSYADAAAVMLANLDRGNAMAHHRVGLALPVGMRGRKPQ